MKIEVGCRSSMRLERSHPENHYLLVVRRITWENRMSTSVVLSPHFDEFVQQQLASGRFNNTSEVADKAHGTDRVVLGDEVRDGVQVLLDVAGELQPFHLAIPLASAIA